jgi:hypothetical protein
MLLIIATLCFVCAAYLFSDVKDLVWNNSSAFNVLTAIKSVDVGKKSCNSTDHKTFTLV